MGNIFGKRPKVLDPVPISPKPIQVPVTSVRKDIFAQLAKRRKATVMNRLTSEPSTLRRTLGGA